MSFILQSQSSAHRPPAPGRGTLNCKIIGHSSIEIIIFQGQFSILSAFSIEKIDKSCDLYCNSRYGSTAGQQSGSRDHCQTNDRASTDRPGHTKAVLKERDLLGNHMVAGMLVCVAVAAKPRDTVMELPLKMTISVEKWPIRPYCCNSR